MGGLRSARRKLNQRSVWIAQETERQKVMLARKVIAERAAKSAEFAAELLKVVGDNLPKEIKEAAEKSVKERAVVGGDKTHEMVPVQTDGGGEVLVNPDQLLDSPKDGEKV